jgi:hypothetical protein
MRRSKFERFLNLVQRLRDIQICKCEKSTPQYKFNGVYMNMYCICSDKIK